MRILLLLFFFLSGACGLIYEIVWTKLIALLIGSTTFSITTVLVAFMGGLALGSYIGGRIIDRRGDPLLTYGIMEGLVGLYCLAVPFLVRSTEPAFAYFYNNYYTDNFYILSLARFFISTLILLVPTTMMGATLPILSRYFVSRRAEFGWDVGKLYAVNTFGAVMGSFGSGFILLPLLGKWLTIVSAASANLLICALVVIYRLFIKKKESAEEGAGVVEEPSSPAPSSDGSGGAGFKVGRMVVWAVLLAYAANGFAGMSYQLAWTRSLALSFGSSTYAFSAIVTVFILGLAFGSGVGARLVDRLKNPVTVFGWVEAAIGFSSVGIVLALGRLPVWMVTVMETFKQSYNGLLAAQLGIVFVMIFIPTFLMGTAFPLAVKIVSMGRSGVGRPVGLAYGWNTGGAIAGSFIAGFVLIPVAGLQNTIAGANLINWLAASMLLALGWTAGKRRGLKMVWASTPLIVGLLITAVVPRWDQRIINSGPFIYFPQYLKDKNTKGSTLDEVLEDYDILFHEEGADATVSVMRQSGTYEKFLRVNGKTDASMGADMKTQEMVAHIPMMMYSGPPPKVLVIGLASGVTVGSVTRYPVESVDVLEISEAVVHASHEFDEVNYNILKDPRVNLIVGDGRNHMKLTDKKYDIIISEPPNPWLAGISTLFTREFYQSAMDHLNEGGIFCCWAQSYSMRFNEFGIMLKTFLKVFPNATIWESFLGADYILIGGKGPYRADLNRFAEYFYSPGVNQDFKRIGITDMASFFICYLMGPAELAEVTEGFEIHTDDRLQLEYRTPRYMQQDTFTGLYKNFLRFSENPLDTILKGKAGLTDEFRNRLSNYVEARKLITRARQRELNHQIGDAVELYRQSLRLDPENFIAKNLLYQLLRDLAEVFTKTKKFEQALEIYKEMSELKPNLSINTDRVGAIYLQTGKIEDARDMFNRALEKNPGDLVAKYNIAYIELMNNNLEKAEQLFKEIIAERPDYANALNGMGVVAMHFGRLDEAAKYFEMAIKQDPRSADAHMNLGLLLIQNDNRLNEGVEHLQRALDLEPNSPNRQKIEESLKWARSRL